MTRRRGSKTERSFWQSGGGYDRHIANPATLSKMIDDVHDNPVRRGWVDRPTDWVWSSAGWVLAGVEGRCQADAVPGQFGG